MNRTLFKLFCLFFIFSSISCSVKRISTKFESDTKLLITNNEVNIVYVPEQKRIPPHLLVEKIETYQLNQGQSPIPLKKEIDLNPLMHDLSLKAVLKKNGKVIGEYFAEKTAHSVSDNNNRQWSFKRPQLSLLIPYITSEHEVSLITSYTWMDMRWHEPVFLEANLPTVEAKVNIEVPYGVNSILRLAQDGLQSEIAPAQKDIKKDIWGQKNNLDGLGTRFSYFQYFGPKASVREPAQRMQLFFAFDSPTQNEQKPSLDNWSQVASYFYDRIDRYDYSSNAIGAFARQSCENNINDFKRASCIINFLNNSITKRPASSSLLNQEVQPASKTFAKRNGTNYDVVILAKAMLESLSINSEIIVVNNESHNPKLLDFYSPALFHQPGLIVNFNGASFYFDPVSSNAALEPVANSLAGQNFLTVRKNNGQFLTVPKPKSELTKAQDEPLDEAKLSQHN